MTFLKEAIKINRVEIPNRLVMPPMATSKSNADGTVSDALCEYYAGYASGGYIGLIVTEHSYISKEGQAGNGQLSIAKDSDVEGLRKLVAAIRQSGTKVIAQVNHAGGRADSNVTGCAVLGASAVPVPGGQTPQEMGKADIDKVVTDFAQAAARAKEAGFDGVEIHSAHGYLLNQFYSPLTNKRLDAYGGTLAGRIKIHLEVIEAVRAAVGDEYLLALRLGASDYADGGTTIEDSVQASAAFEKAGVDLLDISGGFCGFTNPTSKEQGYFGELSQAIKGKVALPVIVTGGVVDAQAAEALLAQGKADLVGVGRAMLEDVQWAKKAMTGA